MTPEQAERAQHAGLMNVLIHTEGWTLYQEYLARQEAGVLTRLCEASTDFADTQYLRGRLAGLREAQTLPARVIRDAKA